MRLLRSWPRRVPEGRNYVNDTIERLVIDNHKYEALENVDDDVLLLEWDIAVGQEELAAFAERARREPDRVLVAPYRLYVTSFKSLPLPKPVWVHRYADGRHVETDAPFCHWFGLGMTYLPKALVRGYLEAMRANNWAGGFDDTGFSAWHWRTQQVEVPITWDIRPVHLHYQIPPIG